MRVSVSQFGGLEQLQLEEVDLEKLSGRIRLDQIVVRVKAAGINPVETYVRAGLYDPLPSLPYTPGSDGAGEIISVGAETQIKFLPGDRVWLSGSVSGTYADYCVCNEEDVHVLPNALSFEQGAALGVAYRTAYRGLVVFGKAKRGESVLIHGASGGVGIAAIQIARMLGLAPIIATASDTEAAEFLRTMGAHHVCRHGEWSDPVDVIFENMANANLGKDLKILKKHARVVVVGNRGEVPINPRDLMRAEATVTGFVGAGSPAEKEQADAFIQAGLERGEIVPVVGVVFSLAQVQDAHAEVMSHSRGTRGKIVIVP